MAGARTGGRILVEGLIAQGCDRIFTVPGESFLAVLDALHDTPDVDLVVCRQEGGAAFMAAADGALTGRPGIVFATRGPGATNASIGVHVAMQDSLPMILFIGDVAMGDRDREAFQEVDFAAMFRPLAKWAARIDDARRIPEYLARAYATAMSGRPGPVVLALPEDMLTSVVEAHDRPRVEPPVQAPAPVEMARLATLIGDARAPVAIVGGADWTAQAGTNVAAFAERIGLPLVTAFRRQDAVDNRSPVYAGNLGYGPNPALLERVRDADLLIVIGARLGEATTDGYSVVTPAHPGQTLAHVHPDPVELNRVYRADLAICAGMGAFAAALDGLRIDRDPFRDGAHANGSWQHWRRPVPTAAAIDLGACVEAMQARFGDHALICNGAGNFSGWWHRHWRYCGPGSQLAPTAGAMGYGLPAAIAAACRRPDATVIAIAGDGDFLMNGQELATAAQHGCDLIVVVVDNGGYGTIRMHQERRHPGRVSGTTLANPDFAALARAFGALAETVTTTAAFGPALDRVANADGIRLLHLRTEMEDIAPGGVTITRLRDG